MTSNIYNPVATEPYFSYLLQYFHSYEIDGHLSPLSSWHHKILNSAHLKKFFLNLIYKEFGEKIFQFTRDDIKEQSFWSFGTQMPYTHIENNWKVHDSLCKVIQSTFLHKYTNIHLLIGRLYKSILTFGDSFDYMSEMLNDTETLTILKQTKAKLGMSLKCEDFILNTKFEDLQESMLYYPILRTLYHGGSYQALKFLLFDLISHKNKNQIIYQSRKGFMFYDKPCQLCWSHHLGICGNFTPLLSDIFERLWDIAINVYTKQIEDQLYDQMESEHDIIHHTWKKNNLASITCVNNQSEMPNNNNNNDNNEEKKEDNYNMEKENDYVDTLVYDLYQLEGTQSFVTITIDSEKAGCKQLLLLRDLMIDCMKYGISLRCPSDTAIIENNGNNDFNSGINYGQTDHFSYCFDYWQWIYLMLRNVWFGKEFAGKDMQQQVLNGELQDYGLFATYEPYQFIFSLIFMKQFLISLFEQAFECTLKWIKDDLSNIEDNEQDKENIHDNRAAHQLQIEEFMVNHLSKILFVLGALTRCEKLQDSIMQTIDQCVDLNDDLVKEREKVLRKMKMADKLIKMDETRQKFEAKRKFLTNIFDKIEKEHDAGFGEMKKLFQINLEKIQALVPNFELIFEKIFVKYDKMVFGDGFGGTDKDEYDARLRAAYQFLTPPLRSILKRIHPHVSFFVAGLRS